ncbi:hypothetical protein BLNAU_17600 [Blattamonas nauphoetae]|uniref:Uncharacterized protein n=1 Tax=Blattamonas nauphoetae TaxID=2049346 RepID=A0ABQ9X6P8_9EUKA|nr:hypothetical protein BLNAU_17600 [Blattamonas nauphoetae]
MVLPFLLLALSKLFTASPSPEHSHIDVSHDFAAFLDIHWSQQNQRSLSGTSPVIIPNGVYHAHDIHINSRNVDISGLSSRISHGNRKQDIASNNKSQYQKDNAFVQEKQVSVMFDVWNSTFSVDNLQLHADTPDTAVSLIRSSTFVRLVGVSVSKSTNHLCGTSGVSLDWVGSSLLSNSSFSSCVTNDAPDPIDEPVPESGQEFDSPDPESGRISLLQSDSDETEFNPIWITSCAFTDILFSVYPYNGAAILIQYKRADIVIKACSFTGCHATHGMGQGGAIFLWSPSSSDAKQYSTTLFNCQFTNNTAGSGGHLSTQLSNRVTIAQCTFSESGPRVGSSLPKYSSVRVSLTGDCRFDNCTLSDNEGADVGALEILQSLPTGKVVLTDVLFDENVCTLGTQRQRVTDCVILYDTGIGNNEFFNCFSTSAHPHCGRTYAQTIFPALIGPSITSVVPTIQGNGDGDEYYALSFTGVFTGTSTKYDITFEGPEGQKVIIGGAAFGRSTGSVALPVSNPSVPSLSPSTTYSIVDVKKSASEATSNAFSEGGVAEPDWTWWHHTPESRQDNMVALSFTTPAGPTLTSITADPNPLNLNEVIVTLTVDNIVSGSLTLLVIDTSDAMTDISLGPFSFTSPSTQTSLSHAVMVYPSGKLSYGKTYTVKSLSSPTLVVSHTTPTVTMPSAPPRISFASPTLSGENKTSVTLTLTGETLSSNKGFTIVVKELDGNEIKSGALEIELTGTIGGTSGSTETTCTANVEIYNKTKTLEYSKNYKIVSLDVAGQAGVADSTATFTVPPSPGRVEGTEDPILNGMKTTVSVTVKGVNLSSITEIVVTRGESTRITSTSIAENTGTQLTARFEAGIEESGTELGFGKRYEIVGVSGGSEVFVNSGVGFTVPTPGIVSSTSTALNSETNEEFKVIVNGKNFMIDSEWILKLTGRNEEISVTMTSTVKGESSWVKAGGPNEIEFFKSYTLLTMTQTSKPSEHLVCAGISLETPTGPTLTDVTCSLNASNLNESIVSVTVERCAAGSFTLLVIDPSDALTEISIGPFSFSSPSTQTSLSHTMVIHPSGLLSYGTTYTVKTFSSSSLIVSHTLLSLEVPSAPPRISFASPTLSGENKTSVTLTLTGETLSSNKGFTIVVKELDGNEIKSGALEIELTGTIGGTSGSTETTCTANVEIYNKTKTLEYSKNYKIVSLDVAGQAGVADSTATFTVPPSPGRVEGTEDPILNGMKTTVSVTVNGVNFPSPIASITVKHETTVISSTSIVRDSESQLTAVFGAGKAETSLLAEFGKRYEIVEISGGSTVFVNSGVGFTVPVPPTLTGVHGSFATKSNTTFHLILEGTDLPVDKTFLVSLEGFRNPIEVTFTSITRGSSTELALGWPDTLTFNSAYRLLSVLLKPSPSISIPFTDFTLQTDTRPDPLILYTNDSANSDPKFCGAVNRPCSSVDVAWMIVEAYSAQTVSLVLITHTHLTSPMIIESGQDVIVEKHVLPPSLVIPSTASLGDSAGLVSVAGTLVLKEVEIEVQVDSLSFVFFDVEGGKLVMDSVHISGVPSSSSLMDGIEGLCSWETGLIKLHESNCSLTSCVLSSIEMGELWMESSNLSLISTQILSCGAQFSLFPSAQQDVMCNSGNITILPSSSDTSEDHWISSTSECSVVLNRTELNSPHFVPSPDTKNSKSTLSKKKDSFSVLIVGSKLIPCDLKLEVSESSSSSQLSKSNSDPVLIPLSFSSAESWNETHINLSVASSSLSSLSLDEKWTARIVFGKGEHTDSFTFLESLKERKAEALRKSLPWLIPVIVCSVLLLLAIIIVIVVIAWRRKQKMSKHLSSDLGDQQELGEIVEKIDGESVENQSTDGLFALNMDNEENGLIARNHPLTVPNEDEPKSQARNIQTTNQVEAMICEGEFAIVMVDGHDTLYNRIHKGDGVAEGKRREIEEKIVRGMMKMVEGKLNQSCETRLSPHWILLNQNDSVFLRIHSELEKRPDKDHPSLPSNTQRSASQSSVKEGIEEWNHRK